MLKYRSATDNFLSTLADGLIYCQDQIETFFTHENTITIEFADDAEKFGGLNIALEFYKAGEDRASKSQLDMTVISHIVTFGFENSDLLKHYRFPIERDSKSDRLLGTWFILANGEKIYMDIFFF